MIDVLTSLFTFVIRVSWQGTPVILLVLLARWLLGNRIPARWSYLLWTLVLIRLIVPLDWLPSSPVSLHNLPTGRPELERLEQVVASTTSQPIFSAPAEIKEDRPVLNAPTREPAMVVRPAGVSWVVILEVIWLLGVVGLLASAVYRQVVFMRLIQASHEPVSLPLHRIWRRCCERFDVQNPPEVWTSLEVDSPCLAGLFRPRLLLPAAPLEDYTDEEYQHILLHELAHFHRLDHWTLLCQHLIRAIHWFNPLVWIAIRSAEMDREMAADERALLQVETVTPNAYGYTLLKIAFGGSRACPKPMSLGLMENKSQLKLRLQRIVVVHRRRRLATFLGALSLTILAVVVLSQKMTSPMGNFVPVISQALPPLSIPKSEPVVPHPSAATLPQANPAGSGLWPSASLFKPKSTVLLLAPVQPLGSSPSPSLMTRARQQSVFSALAPLPKTESSAASRDAFSAPPMGLSEEVLKEVQSLAPEIVPPPNPEQEHTAFSQEKMEELGHSASLGHTAAIDQLVNIRRQLEQKIIHRPNRYEADTEPSTAANRQLIGIALTVLGQSLQEASKSDPAFRAILYASHQRELQDSLSESLGKAAASGNLVALTMIQNWGGYGLPENQAGRALAALTQANRSVSSGDNGIPSISLEKIQELASRVVKGEDGALDDLARVKQQLFLGIRYENGTPIRADLGQWQTGMNIMKAAFKQTADAVLPQSGEEDPAFQALLQAAANPSLKPWVAEALGRAAVNGHAPSLDALLDWRQTGLLESAVVPAINQVAEKGNYQARQFLVEIINDEHAKGLWSQASLGLAPAAARGDSEAINAIAKYTEFFATRRQSLEQQ